MFILQRLTVVAVLLCSMHSVHSAVQAQPSIQKVEPQALQLGATTQLSFAGGQLTDDSRIICDSLVITQQQMTKADGKSLQLEVTLDTDVIPGLHALRIINASGISAPVVVRVDSLGSIAFVESCPQTPLAMFGELRGAQVLKTSLAGKANERLVVEIEGQRLGSNIRPVVHVYNSRGTQIEWSQPIQHLSGDTRLEVSLPADDQYNIELHDILFRSPGNSFFRMKIGDFAYADSVFPLALQTKQQAEITFPGSSLPANFKTTISASAQAGDQQLRVVTDLQVSSLPSLQVTDFPQVIETESAETVTELTAPLGLQGRLQTAREIDRFRIAARKGQKLRFEMFASRLGSQVDGQMTLKNADGNQLANNDDQDQTSDPALEYEVAEGVNQLVLEVFDVTGNAGVDHVYMVRVTDLNEPDFSLSASSASLNLPGNSQELLLIEANRAGYQGPIALAFEPQPVGLTIKGNSIPEGSNRALLTISREDVSVPLTQNFYQIVGTDASGNIKRLATWPATPATRQARWVERQIAIAASGNIPFEFAMISAKPQALLLGGNLRGKVEIKRGEKVTGPIRVRLETNQTIPKKTIKENNQDKVVDDLDRTLRLTGDIMLTGEMNAADFTIAVPNDLPERDWALLLVAELLTDDQKAVKQTSVLPVELLPARRALSIEVTGERRVEVDPGNKKAGKVTGKITRHDFPASVVISLAGVDEKIPAQSVQVPADQETFELSIELPEDVKAEQLNNAAIIATSLDPNDANLVTASSNKVKIAIALPEAAAENKPAEEKPAN
jgi:hypothetical protein